MSDLVLSGINLMVMGMGTVFVFLTILVFGTSLMSKIIMQMPGVKELEKASSNTQKRKSGANDDFSEIAAVAAAIRHTRKI